MSFVNSTFIEPCEKELKKLNRASKCYVSSEILKK